MFGFGGLSEVFFILFLALLIFGPEKLPEIGRKLAKGMAEVRKASNELKRTLNAELAVSEQELEARRLAAVPPVPPVPPVPSEPPVPAVPAEHPPPAGLAGLAAPALEAPDPADSAHAAEPTIATIPPMQPYGEGRVPHGQGVDADLP
jgi:TatA/E family protein of Tat protein translocase